MNCFLKRIVLPFYLASCLGPIGHAQFSTVLNIPPDPDIANSTTIHSGTQVNLGEGGSIGTHVKAGLRSNINSNLEINITGGTVGRLFTAQAYVVVNISGGRLGDSADFNSISSSTFTGGTIDDWIDISTLTASEGFSIHGSDFRIDGVPVAGLDTPGDTVVANVPTDTSDYLLTGVLVDGTPFAFSRQDRDRFRTQPNLVAATVPTVGPPLITASAGNTPLGIRAGQTMLVDAGGNIGDSFNATYGSTVHVTQGGTVGDNLEVVGGTLLIEGGTLGSRLDAIEGTTVTMTGGEVDLNAWIGSGSSLNVTGGHIGEGLEVSSGGTMHMSETAVLRSPLVGIGGTAQIAGGVLENGVRAYGGAMTFSGGALGGHADFSADSMVTFQGGEFKLNGTPIAGLTNPGDTTTVMVPEGSLISGTLADGTPFAFNSGANRDSDIENATLTLELTSLPSIGPSLIVASTDPIPHGIRAGQTLVADVGSTVPSGLMAGPGSTVEIHRDASLVGNIKGIGATMNLQGGEIGGTVMLYDGSTMNVESGAVEQLDVAQGSIVNMSGGSIGTTQDDYDPFWLSDTAVLNLSGGSFDSSLYAEDGSEVNIFGTEFYLDSVAIEDLTLDVPQIITERGGRLTGKLLDGTPFEFYLYGGNDSSVIVDQFSPLATVNIIRSLGTADFNGDEVVDAVDLVAWQTAYGTTDAADANSDGVSNGADFLAWQRQHSPGAVVDPSAVPEPTSVVLLILAGIASLSRSCSKLL